MDEEAIRFGLDEDGAGVLGDSAWRQESLNSSDKHPPIGGPVMVGQCSMSWAPIWNQRFVNSTASCNLVAPLMGLPQIVLDGTATS